MEFENSFHGDFIQQTKSEMYSIKRIFIEIEQKKIAGLEYDKGNRTSLDVPIFISFSFECFKKYVDDKLGVSNPIIYMDDLAEIYSTAEFCFKKYCQIIEKKIPEVKKILKAYSEGDFKIIDLNVFIQFSYIYYCYRVYIYIERINKYFNGIHFIPPQDKNIELINDFELVKNIISDSFKDTDDTRLENFIYHILSYKYPEKRPPNLPVIYTKKLSQRKIYNICRQIKSKFGWGPTSNNHLAETFGKLVKDIVNRENIYYNATSIKKNI